MILDKKYKETPIGVIGAGAWGTAISKLLCKNGSDVKIWCHSPETAKDINCLLYTSPSPRDLSTSRMPSSA